MEAAKLDGPAKGRTFSADAAAFQPMSESDYAPTKNRTFSADAAVFKPMSEMTAESYEEGTTKDVAMDATDVQAWADMMAYCATAAPSPALSALSSLGGNSAWPSPYWCQDGTGMGGWPVGAMAGLTDEFSLPEAEAMTASSEVPSSQEDGGASLAPIAEFTFSGMKEILESSILTTLQKVNKAEEEDTAAAQKEIIVESSDKEAHHTAQPAEIPTPPPKSAPKNVSAEITPPPGLEDERDEAKWPVGTTTVMLRNIPNKYTQKMMVDVIRREGYTHEVDFMYLPIDFKNRCNVGYVFINFRTEHACLRFAAEFHQAASREKLPGFNSQKICEVVPAKFQGQVENVRRLQTNPVMAALWETPEWLPQIFDEDGEELPFPTSGSNAANNKNAKGGRTSRKTVPAAPKPSSKDIRGRQWD
eukprot:TRINITY_DN28475_c0_g1_i1.p1 TRINITY_DN28475_c0_g1~~TRINITY_DN28475_c0_g1_i1.p1  ORF type:complete len:477 (-),score=114.79 TRINITY_DN28475_c0_g1_i1:338-1591(-)